MSACLEVMVLCLFYCTSGENFDRQASIRRSLIYTDTVVRRPKKVKRRKTITGVPDNIQRELGMAHQNCIPLWLIRITAYHDWKHSPVLMKPVQSDSLLKVSNQCMSNHKERQTWLKRNLISLPTCKLKILINKLNPWKRVILETMSWNNRCL